MSIYEKMHQTMEDRSIDGWKDFLHEDYEFVRHQSGKVLNKAETLSMMEGFLKSDKVVEHSRRCLYENDEILVVHSVVDFPDDSREAILAVYLKKDGKLIKCETGATPLKK